LAGSDAEFVPFIAEADGGLLDAGVNFLKRVAEAATEDNSCGWSSTEAYRAIVSEVAVAIQKGNHRIVRRALSSNRRAGFVIKRAQAGQPDEDVQSFYGDDRDIQAQSAQHEQQEHEHKEAEHEQQEAEHEHKQSDHDSTATTQLVSADSPLSHKPHSQPKHAQNLDYKDDEHDEHSPVFPSPNTARHAAARIGSRLLADNVQIDASVNQLLASPSQRDALHERGVELPLRPSQSQESPDLLGEFAALLASPERVAMRERGVVLPFNSDVQDTQAEAGASHDAPIELS
jgi:hypothetical protein